MPRFSRRRHIHEHTRNHASLASRSAGKASGWAIPGDAAVARPGHIVAAMLALALVATLLTTGSGEASADEVRECRVVHPTDGYVYEQGERQIFRFNCVGDPVYNVSFTIEQSVTGQPTHDGEFSTVPSTSGMDSSRVLLPFLEELPPGMYTLNVNFPPGHTITGAGVTFGVASLIGAISSTCADGRAAFDGDVSGFRRSTGWERAPRYSRLRSYQPTANEAWICLTNSRLQATFSDGPNPVDVVTSVGPCDGGDDGLLPRPLSAGESAPGDPVRHTTWRADLRRANNQVSICFKLTNAALGAFEASILIAGAEGSELQSLRLVPDAPGQSFPTPRPPRPNTQPSSDCHNRTLPPDTRWGRFIDAHIMDTLVRIDQMAMYFVLPEYGHGSGPEPVPHPDHGYALCWRLESGSQTSGGRLDLSGPTQLETVGWDLEPPPALGPGSPCTITELTMTLLGAEFEVHYSDPDPDDGANVCLRAAGLGIDASVLAGDDEDVQLLLDP